VRDYTVFGLRIQSALSLPEAPRWSGDSRPPDVVISVGVVDSRRDAATSMTWGDLGGVYVDDPESVRFEIKAARFLVTPTHVVVEPRTKNAVEIRTSLLGSVFGILCYQRGLLPLHASAFAGPDGVIAVGGDRGVGKSTTAARLALRGVSILSDDLCAVDCSEDSRAMVWPSVARIKLRPDAVDRLGLSRDSLDEVGDGSGKYLLPVPSDPTALGSLRAVCRLSLHAAERGPSVRLCSGLEAVQAARDILYRSYLVPLLGREASVGRTLLSFLDCVAVYDVRRSVFETADVVGALRLNGG
jgi:hypothetical protein